jgi:hypothetical protein
MAVRKQSGTALIDRLGPVGGIDGFADRLAETTPRPDTERERPRGGRPAKAGPESQPVNVRLASEDHLKLSRLAGELAEPKRPMPTVQDLIRRVVRGALKNTETLKHLYKEGA